MARFLVSIALDGALPAENLSVARRAAAASDLTACFSAAAFTLFAKQAAYTPLADQGIILGALYRGDCVAPATLSNTECRAIVGTAGSALFAQFWGNYVAFLSAPDGCTVVRAPFGNLPLVLCRHAGTILAASDVGLLASCGAEVGDIDWPEIACHLAAPDIQRSQTCLAGVSELRGGSRLIVGLGRHGISPTWTPWPAAQRARQHADDDEAAQRVFASVQSAVATSVGRARRPLLLLSGGLDSSIVASALHAAGSAFCALTFTTAEPAGDERAYARRVAASLGIELVERERQIDHVDIARSGSAGLPRPSRRSFHQDSDALTDEVARQVGADFIVEGGGGDNVFCSLQSVAPVADLMRAGASWSRIVAGARDVAALSEATLATVLRRAWYRAWLRRTPLRSPIDTSLLTPEAVAAATTAVLHPWLQPPRGAWPGSAAHIALLVAAQGWVESFDPVARLATACPLVAQPVVEACLAVPSWRWFGGGQNRVIAREAFRGRLPDKILDRRSKATPDSFVTRLYEHNRRAIADLLLDGLLVSRGIVDRGAVAAVLRAPGPPRTHAHRRVMRLVDAEVWARHRPR